MVSYHSSLCLADMPLTFRMALCLGVPLRATRKTLFDARYQNQTHILVNKRATVLASARMKGDEQEPTKAGNCPLHYGLAALTLDSLYCSCWGIKKCLLHLLWAQCAVASLGKVYLSGFCFTCSSSENRQKATGKSYTRLEWLPSHQGVHEFFPSWRLGRSPQTNL